MGLEVADRLVWDKIWDQDKWFADREKAKIDAEKNTTNLPSVKKVLTDAEKKLIEDAKLKNAKAAKDKNIIHGDGDGTGGGKKSEGITEDIHGNPWDSQSHAQDMADQHGYDSVADYNEAIADVRAEGGRVGYFDGGIAGLL